MSPRRRYPSNIIVACLLLTIPVGCGWFRQGPETGENEAPNVVDGGIPTDRLEDVLDAHYDGLGRMERYEYPQAAAAFREVIRLAPDWLPGRINLAIALLNQSGESEAEAEKQGRPTDSPKLSNYEEALALLDSVLEVEPNNLHARYCRGIILEHVGRWEDAFPEFEAVVEAAPDDAHALYWMANTMPDDLGGSAERADPEARVRPAKETRPELVLAPLERAVALNPDLTPALYALSRAYIVLGRRDDYDRITERWGRLNPQRSEPPPGIGEPLAKVYGEMGRYAEVVGPPSPRSKPVDDAPPLRFGPFREIDLELPEGHRWAASDDFEGPLAPIGAARDRFGVGVAAADYDRDGRLDLYLTGAIVGPEGVRDALLLNRGDGRFEDASQAFGLPNDRVSLGVAAGDFDADFFPDLYLTGPGPNVLLRNTGGSGFEDLTSATGTDGGAALSLTARWLDLDLDGDLDLYVVNRGDDGRRDGGIAAGAANLAFRNDGKPVPLDTGTALSMAPLANEGPKANAVAGLQIAFSKWDEAQPLSGGRTQHSGVAAMDIDADRDLDLVLAADGEPLTVLLNDRLGAFHEVAVEMPNPPDRVSGLLVADFDRDGRPDLTATSAGGRAVAWRNVTEGRGASSKVALESLPIDAQGWRSASLADLDLDGRLDLVATSLSLEGPALWAHNQGERLANRLIPAAPPAGEIGLIVGGAVVDLVGEEPLPDLVYAREGAPPLIAENRGNGRHWLGLDLGGRWNIYPELMRTNPHGIGAKVDLEGDGLSVPYHHTTTSSGPGQSVTPFVLGLGDSDLVPLIRLRWPDGVMQTEMNQAADVLIPLAEKNRKTGSCPVLFTWNGRRFDCIGDILGGGGLGYLVAPGVYGQPDRDEMVHITDDQLQATEGVYRLSITEPMDEVAYLDHLVLDVVDRPPGLRSHPDERFAPGGNRPTGDLLAWRLEIDPEHATDLRGRDVSDLLLETDRRTVDDFKRHVRWVGYAEEHGIVLDFGDRLAGFGPDDPLILCLSGWVEYPYSQTNYAASTAGLELQPPVLERLDSEGHWTVIEADPGYPAGLPRMTTLDLTGKLGGDCCVLRLRSNMECYWDEAFIAVRDREGEDQVRVTSLPIEAAKLGPRGYTREVSPDGRLPLIYDYDYVDPAPLAPFAGTLTRFGDVAELLLADDDRLCLVGPGDEVRLDYRADAAPPLPEGWTRSFVLRAIGYCKDADPFTAGSDDVGPLPWRRMPPYPFADDFEPPADPFRDRDRAAFHNRPAGGD